MAKSMKLLSRLLRDDRGNVAAIFALSSIPVLGITGTYSGTTGNAAGSESGITPQNVTYPGQTSAAGTVYKNDYCKPKEPTASIFDQVNGSTRGVFIPPVSGDDYAGPAPAGFIKWKPSEPAVLTYGDDVEYQSRRTSRYRPGSYTNQPFYTDHWMYLANAQVRTGLAITRAESTPVDASNPYFWGPATYYVPHVANPVGLTPQMRTGRLVRRTPNSMGNTTLNYGTFMGLRTGPVGAFINIDDSIPVPAPAVNAATNGYGGYWFVESINDNGTLNYYWQETGYYIPLYKSLTPSSSSVSGSDCSTTPTKGPLITCVTERTGSQDYSDADPTSYPVGAYNHGDSSISNYSSDGKCWTAGRELAKVIPLTNDKKTLGDFFDKAEFGGGTPGHLGTAWAWYTLSPKWNSIWPSASKASDYETKEVKKSVVIVTDGEYNMEYSSDSSRKQALALCKAMKDKGITVYTVGVGFSTNSTISDSTADGKAKDLLTQCASSAKHAYFPYDGTDLQKNLSDIGRTIKSQQSVTAARMTN